MKWKWAAALLLLPGLGAASSHAAGFGFTITNATVVNHDNVIANGRADVGESFDITGATFTSYLSTGPADGVPAIADADLNRYSANVHANVVSVVGDVVSYTGTFAIRYTGPGYPSGADVATGNVTLTATFDALGRARVNGLFQANPGPAADVAGDPNFAGTDFSPFNPGRFSGAYLPDAGGATGKLTGGLNAGQEGFLATINQAAMTNDDANHNGMADVGETFTLTAPLASYWPTNPGALLPLTDSDLSRYTITLNGTARSVVGHTVGYDGTFRITYTGPGHPSGVDVETGGFLLTAQFNEGATASAKLTGTFYATPGVEAGIQGDPQLGNTDFAIFNPATFNGTYTPNTVGGGAGTVSGSLSGGVVGFSASLANGAVTNVDNNPANGKADVGETFTADIPLAAYVAVGAPELLDKDLSRYSVHLNGTVASVVGSSVQYAGAFRITYTGPDATANIEAGSFAITANFKADGSAELDGTLHAFPGAETPVAPFDGTDFSPFNDVAFTGHYEPNAGDPAHGTLRGSLVGGSNVPKIVSRKVGASIEGSVTAATLAAPSTATDNRRAIVASGNKLYVIDPVTGDDAPGWAGGATLDGAVAGRAAYLGNDLFVGTVNGTLYRFSLTNKADTSSVQPGGAGSAIYTAPAVAASSTDPTKAGSVYVSVSHPSGSASVVKLDAQNLGATPVPTFTMDGAVSVSSPAVPGTGRVFVGSNNGLYSLDAATLTPLGGSVSGLSVPTSPFVAGPTVFVGVGDGTDFRAISASTGAAEPGKGDRLDSPLMISAFYEKRSNLLQAGLADGRIRSFDMTGTPLGYTLPGLFNPVNTGGSFSMPVQANNILYRATEKAQIISGIALNGDNQQTVDLISKAQGAVSATGQTPGADFVLASSPDGYVHMLSVR